MSKVFSGALCIILLLSLLCFFTNTSFDLKVYADNLNDIPDKPTLPSFDYVSDSFNEIESIGDLGVALGNFIKFLFDCIMYPFEWIAYIIEVVVVLTNGMIVEG